MQDPAALPRATPEEVERNKQYWEQFKANPADCEEPSFSEGEGGESAEGEDDPVVEPEDLQPRMLFESQSSQQDSQQEKVDEEGGLDGESNSGSETLELSPCPKPYKTRSSSHMDVDAVEAAFEGHSILNI